MPSIIGRNIKVGLGKETVRGTKVSPTFGIPRIDFDFDEKIEAVINEASVGVIEDSENQEITKRWSEGSLGGKIRDKSFGLILLSALGSISSALKSGETAVYEHDFSVLQNNQHPSLTLTVEEDNGTWAFPLAMLNSLEMVVELGAFVIFTANFLSKKGETSTEIISFEDENEFIPKHAEVKIADDLAGLDAAEALKIKALTLTLEKNVESDDLVGATDPNDFLNKQFVISGSMDVKYEDTNLKTIALDGTKKAMRIKLVNSDLVIGTASNPTLELELAKVKATEWSKGMGLDDVVVQTFGFKGFFSITDAKSITAKLINQQASY